VVNFAAHGMAAQIYESVKSARTKNYANVKNTGGEMKHKGAKRASKTKT